MAGLDRSKQLYEMARLHLAGGVSSNFRYAGYGASPVPLFYARGQGAHLYDVDGNRYIDYALANGPIILGHAPEPVIAAVRDSLGMGQLFAGQHEGEVKLARLIGQLVPAAELVRFTSSGSESAHAAIRLARAATGRPKFIKFEGHYHGWLDSVFISVAPSPNAAGPESAPVAVAESPGQAERALEDVIILPWNDLDVFRRALESREAEIAGVIMEPILCNTGSILPRPGYLEGVRELCSKHGVVLIFDEVITGFRVGLGGAQGLLGVEPDLMIFAKALAGGFPLAALAGRRAIMELVETKRVMHGGTYNANVPCIAAGLATLETLAHDNGRAYRDMGAKGERLMEGLRRLARDHRENLLVQGLGTVFHPAFTDLPKLESYRQFIRADAQKRARFCGLLHDAGLRTTARGTWFLSAAHSDDDVARSLDAAAYAFGMLKSA
jgi:glutamate-1-semialdehyde 2,1-aminomutase